MKTPEDARRAVAGRLADDWHKVVAGADSWRPGVALGTSQLKGAQLAARWDDVFAVRMQWWDWEQEPVPGVRLEWRDVSPTQRLPARLVVDDVDAAARLVGGDWADRLARARDRRAVLVARFPGLADPARLLKAVDGYTDADFDVACRAATWFAANPASGRTARQVGVEGMGTKWLARRAAVVRQLASLDDLGLVPGRPSRVHVTYLDADHNARADTRRHDVVTVGDRDVLAYRPRVVVISENRDTAQFFPPVDGGIAVEGDGNGPGAIPDLDWLRDAEVVWYWGDMDAKGLEILDSYRVRGVPARSLFMDLVAYERWGRYGVDDNDDGSRIEPKEPRRLERLEPHEHALYLALCSFVWAGHRRVEQEPIPLEAAAAVVRAG
ncbi:DUF2220 family protein [Nocardioides sp. LHD-245]|uniref:Wadjet anti-phage system protein JetD domain-containing protein n=1 Tax=Nocardioides sp. LHD-245 TaxID=3051387 RepID=UPI0027E07CEF|nr:DUF2220 family protein [Nocardioides sp. LHD-245]